MKTKLQELLNHFDIPEDITKGYMEGEKELTDITGIINDNYVSRKLAKEDEDIKKSIVGNLTGSIGSKLKAMFDLQKSDIEGKKVEEIVEFGLTKKNEELETLKNQLKEKEGDNKDEAVTKLQEDLEKWQNKAKTFETQLMDANKTIEEKENGWASEKKKINIDLQVKDLKGKLNYRDDLSEMEKIGFETFVNNSYKFDLDEKENLIVLNKEGERIKNEKNSDFMLPLDELNRVAAEKKVLKMNNAKETPRHELNGEEIDKNKKIHKNVDIFQKKIRV